MKQEFVHRTIECSAPAFKAFFRTINGKLVIAFPFLLLCTVCVTDNELWRGTVTAKYFYFACAISISVIWAAIGYIRNRQQLLVIRHTDVAVLIFWAYVIIRHIIGNGVFGVQWYLFLLMIPLYCFIRTFTRKHGSVVLLTYCFILFTLVEAVWGILQSYQLLPSYHQAFPVSGSLFNPGPYAGFISIGIPIIFSRILPDHVHKAERVFCMIALVPVLWALTLAGSRAAWMATMICNVILLWKYYGESFHKYKKRWITVAVAVIMIISTIAFKMYDMGKDSADGRMLIWKISAAIIKERPLLGAGYGKFTSVYGNAQASYFLGEEANEKEIMLAGDPEYAFNEYIHIWVELGAIGLILFGWMLTTVLFPQKKGISSLYYCAALWVWLIFAAFSYPLSVLPLGILLVILLAVNASQSRIFFSQTHCCGTVAWIACIVFTCVISIHILSYKRYYSDWLYAGHLLRSGSCHDAASEYEYLYEKLRYEGKLLEEFARSLNCTGQYDASNRIIGKYLQTGSSSDSYITMGNNYQAMKQYTQAEQAYLQSSYLVPNRFTPLYQLMILYGNTGQTDKSVKTAGLLLEKPVKVPSQAIDDMKVMAEQVVKEYR